MQIHIEKEVTYQYHYYVEVTDELKAQLPQFDLSDTDDWLKADWYNFWEAIEDLDYGAQEELIQEDEEHTSYEEIVNLWIEDK